jgi:hypothetical protein
LFTHEHSDWGTKGADVDLWRRVLTISLLVLFFAKVVLLELLVSLRLQKVKDLSCCS